MFDLVGEVRPSVSRLRYLGIEAAASRVIRYCVRRVQEVAERDTFDS